MGVSAQEDGSADSEPTATPETGAITGVAWADADGDGIRGPEEEGLAGVELTLVGSDGAEAGAVTSEDDGTYRFEELAAGTYVVRLVPPEGHDVAATHDAATRAGAEDTRNAFGEIVDGTSGEVTVETEPVPVEPGAEVVLAAGLIPPPAEEQEEETTTTAHSEPGDVSTQADGDVGVQTVVPTGTNIAAAQSFYAYVDAGENLDVTFVKNAGGVGSATITVRGPGVADQSCTVPLGAPVNSTCSILNSTSVQPGVWQIEFAPAGNAGGYTWTINVQDGTTDNTGRVWSERYFMSQGATVNPFNLWYQSEQGFRYQATYANYNGIVSVINADAVGVALLNTCVSAYESMDLIGPNSDTDRLWQPPPGTCGDPYKIFFEAPSTDLPATTTDWNGDPTWVAPAPVVPSLANLQFLPDSATVRSGTFRFDVTNFTGQLTIDVDANGNGVYTDPVDRSIPAAVAQDGTVDVAFDGDDDDGNPIPATQDIGARVSITQAGEIHFTMADVELRNSISVEALNGPSVGNRTLYWNDTALATAGRNCTTPVLDGRDGVDSTGGVHGWTCSNNANNGIGGSWGDQRAIDDWTFQDVNVTVEAAFAGGLEFGDAPDTYGTTLAADGARHLNAGFDDTTNTSPVMLGASIDVEADGLPGAAATGDDTTDVDDEDGVAFNPALGYPNPTLRTGADPVSGTPVQNTVQVTASTPGFASVWVDWNIDGDFGDAGEQVANAQPVVAGPNDVTFTQGTNPPQIATYARVRYSTDAADVAAPTGAALDGEVEDYRVLLERLIEPSVCFDTPDPFYAFTFQAPTVVAPRALYQDVAVVGGVAVDLVIRRTAGGNNSFSFGGDDAGWNISTGSARTLQYTFYVADTYNVADDTGGTTIAVNAAFTTNDMDGTEKAVFTESDLAAYAIGPGSDVTITDLGTTLEFAGHGSHNGDPGSRFLWVIANTSSLSVTWSGFQNSGFGIDGDNDLAFTPTCEDYGDAPAGYGTLLADDGARHTVVSGLQLGAEIDIDPNGQPNAAADGDDTNGLDDEDGVATPIQIAAGSPTNVSVTATNTTAQDATLVGWIDLNGNGTFETGERAIANVPAGSGTVVHNLGFPAGTATTTTYARFRLFPGVVADPSPIGVAAGGEVEDYAVQAAAVHFEKTSDPAPEDIIEVTPGMVFTYTIEVENIGSVPVTGISFVDDLIEVVDDATVTALPTATIGTATFVPPDQITWTGDLGVGETAVIEYEVTVNNPILGNAILLNGVVGTAPGSNCPPPGPATDPDCFEQIPAPLIDTEKTLVGPADPEPGDVVSYQFTVSNVGAAPAFNFEVTDDLAGVLDDATFTAGPTADIGTATFDDPADEVVWSIAALNPTQTATITYSVTVNDATALGDGILQNALLAPDCPDPAIFDPQDPDFDAECVTITDIAAWTSVKSSSAVGPVEAGDDVTYTITVTNTGNVALDDPGDLPTVTDDLSGVIDDAVYNDDADDADNPGTIDYIVPILTWSGALAVDDEVTITYTVTVNEPDALNDGRLVNAVTGAPNCPDPAVTDPQGPGFDPDCAVITDIEAWTAVKTSDVLSPVLSGALINYTITVTNTGSVPVDDFDDLPAVQDDLTDVLDDAAFNDDLSSGGQGSPSYAAPVVSWQGALTLGQTVLITYSVTVNDADELGDGQLVNAITGSPNCPDPAVTDPDQPDFDADCVVITDISAWTSVKTSNASGAVEPGDTITYTIRLANTGNAPLTDPGALPAIQDNLGGVLGDAAYNGDADSGGQGTLSYLAPVLSWEGPLLVAQVVTIAYSVTVNAAGALDDGVLANAVTGAPNCPDPAVTDPLDPNFDPDCAVVQGVRSFTTVKTSDAATPVVPGDVVTFTISVVNNGGAAIVAPDTAQVTDDLSGVLDDATYNAGSATATIGTVGVTGATLSWSGELPVTQSATITYSVTVNDPPQGDFTLRNAIATNGPTCPTPAVTDPSDPAFDENCVVISGVAGVQYEKSMVAPDDPAQIGPGTTLTYQVAARNVGQVDLSGMSFTDDFSGVLPHAAYLGDATATIGSVSYSAPILTWTGDLAVGETALVRYSFRLNDTTPRGTALRNAVTGTGPGAHCNIPGAAALDVTIAQATCVLDAAVGVGPAAAPGTPGALAFTGAGLLRLIALGLLLIIVGTFIVQRVRSGRSRKRPRFIAADDAE